MSEMQFYVQDNYSVAYSWSHGPTSDPLIVLHGLGDSAIHTYGPRFARSVLQHTPALFVDLPGFGESTAHENFPGTIEAMAEAVRALLTSLHLSDAPIFAHSMGANVAIALATPYPHWQGSMILAEPLLNTQDSVLASTIVRFGEKQFEERGFAMLQRATSMQAKRGDMAAEAFLPVLAMANPRATHRAAVSLLAEREPSFLSRMLKMSPSPFLLIGERTQSDLVQDLSQTMQLIRIPGAGHNMLVEAEESTTCVILHLVTGTDND